MSLQSDESKLQMIGKLHDYDKANLVKSLQSDENKIKAMKRHLGPFNYRKVIESLSSNENKIANLHLLYSSSAMLKVLENIEIENDEQRLSIAASVKYDHIASMYIKEIEDEEKKYKQ